MSECFYNVNGEFKCNKIIEKFNSDLNEENNMCDCNKYKDQINEYENIINMYQEQAHAQNIPIENFRTIEAFKKQKSQSQSSVPKKIYLNKTDVAGHKDTFNNWGGKYDGLKNPYMMSDNSNLKNLSYISIRLA